MKTISLTPEQNFLLTNVCAAGSMAIMHRIQENQHNIIMMFALQKKGMYPGKEDKEIIKYNIQDTKDSTANFIATLELLKEKDLIGNDKQKKVVDTIIKEYSSFQNGLLAECEKEFDEVFKLMEDPDYSSDKYRQEHKP